MHCIAEGLLVALPKKAEELEARTNGSTGSHFVAKFFPFLSPEQFGEFPYDAYVVIYFNNALWL